jgi:two-component system chemotaxis response regulator CheY
MPATILIVDDSTILRTMVRDALEADHHHVLEAADAGAALRTVETAPPDLVITDVNMPDTDGITLVRTLRQRERERFIPILVLTTEASDDMKQRGRAAGATGWLVKPFDPARLRDTVKRVLKPRPA